jgi:integrase
LAARCDWLVYGQVVPVNPAHTVRGPRHVVTSGQTPVLDPAEERALLDSIDVSTHAGLRDRALIGLMVYSFARIGAARRSAWRSRMSTRKTDPFGCGCARKGARTVLPQANAYAMIGRRAAAAGIETKLGNHGFRATGITACLKNGGTLKKAAAMANHASTRTTQLYDRRAMRSALMRSNGSRSRRRLPTQTGPSPQRAPFGRLVTPQRTDTGA